MAGGARRGLVARHLRLRERPRTGGGKRGGVRVGRDGEREERKSDVRKGGRLMATRSERREEEPRKNIGTWLDCRALEKERGPELTLPSLLPSAARRGVPIGADGSGGV